MKVNMEKSYLLVHQCENEDEASLANTFPAQRKKIPME
jgi:hypothetical protein